MRRFPKLILPFALLTFAALATAPAQAQLCVGFNKVTGNSSRPGIASISDTGTTVSGNYSYYNYGYVPFDPNAISYSEIDSYNTSTVNISGGSIGDFEVRDSSAVNISGGSLDYLIVRNNSTLNFSGGSATFLQSVSSEPISVSGGMVENLDALSSLITVSGGTTVNLESAGTGIINLLGNNLTENTIPVGNGIGAAYFTVSGTLLGDNSPFSAQYTATNQDVYGTAYSTLEFNGVKAVPGGTPVFAPVPEASSVTSFGLLLVLGMGSFVAVLHRKGTQNGVV